MSDDDSYEIKVKSYPEIYRKGDPGWQDPADDDIVRELLDGVHNLVYISNVEILIRRAIAAGREQGAADTRQYYEMRQMPEVMLRLKQENDYLRLANAAARAAERAAIVAWLRDPYGKNTFETPMGGRIRPEDWRVKTPSELGDDIERGAHLEKKDDAPR